MQCLALYYALNSLAQEICLAIWQKSYENRNKGELVCAKQMLRDDRSESENGCELNSKSQKEREQTYKDRMMVETVRLCISVQI